MRVRLVGGGAARQGPAGGRAGRAERDEGDEGGVRGGGGAAQGGRPGRGGDRQCRPAGGHRVWVPCGERAHRQYRRRGGARHRLASCHGP